MNWLREWMPANRRNWDERAAIHIENRTGFYSIGRLKAGEDILHAIEAAEIGDVTGKRLIHLQCHFGLDTLCLARRGAIATGLDFRQQPSPPLAHWPRNWPFPPSSLRAMSMPRASG
jgi:hypothetical protein